MEALNKEEYCDCEICERKFKKNLRENLVVGLLEDAKICKQFKKDVF